MCAVCLSVCSSIWSVLFFFGYLNELLIRFQIIIHSQRVRGIARYCRTPLMAWCKTRTEGDVIFFLRDLPLDWFFWKNWDLFLNFQRGHDLVKKLFPNIQRNEQTDGRTDKQTVHNTLFLNEQRGFFVGDSFFLTEVTPLCL